MCVYWCNGWQQIGAGATLVVLQPAFGPKIDAQGPRYDKNIVQKTKDVTSEKKK